MSKEPVIRTGRRRSLGTAERQELVELARQPRVEAVTDRSVTYSTRADPDRIHAEKQPITRLLPWQTIMAGGPF